ncbi:capsular polysaccharide biosynthesis protein [Lactiplantibacillus fabifermentans T30PCM01]|uniref:Capsular polysaccharide biosynthesis protein n=1 Tax=Lactiplantibacillus fabifermentans T30PCM01 TaxID=1400520 RepID=W6T411_9LACO|nr:capsular polysaccharide biosynthesis protein [Lactiplantibacillus fabifermentans T30PCM01]
MRQVEAVKNEGKLVEAGSRKYEFQKAIGEPISGRGLVFKRAFDLVVGIIGLIISMPLIFIFGLLVKITSKGPALYKQERVGVIGKTFKVIKLRSMYQDAELKTGAIWARKDDNRVTPIGRFMRKTRIDELPQFWNVLKGDMSLVGPRPERPMLTEKFSVNIPEFPQRLRITPGITGYAQVNGGYDITPKQKCKFDNYYIEHYSLWFDVRILVATIKIICTGDGAR